ncbi:MAG: arylamine N-acetyltransferase [Gemmatimonadota bacterium]|jgi:N-hydroxyarylamine O-acetyltransferase
MIDLDAYLERVGIAREDLRPDFESLEALHLAHIEAIPFENIDVRLRRPIRLDPPSLHDKLVSRRRGGYCFEHNSLFAAALRGLDFDVATLEARVRPRGATSVMGRTHMTLHVRLEEGDYIADVGFGGSGPLLPVPLDGTVSLQFGGEYSIGEEAPGAFALRTLIDGEWLDLYGFGLTPVHAIDYEVANHFTSTYPKSPFLNTLTVQRSRPSGRHILRGRTYITQANGDETVREIDPEELPGLLRETFAIEVTDEEALEALGDA